MGSNQKRAGIIAITAGCIGLVSLLLLIGGLVARPYNPDVGRIGIAVVLLRGQDIAITLQVLLMILVTLAILRQTAAFVTEAPGRAADAWR